MSQASDKFFNIFQKFKEKPKSSNSFFMLLRSASQSIIKYIVLLTQKSIIFILRQVFEFDRKKYGWALFFSNLPNVGNMTRDLYILMLRHLQSMVFLTLLNTVNNFICCSRQTYQNIFLRHAFTRDRVPVQNRRNQMQEWGPGAGGGQSPPSIFGQNESKTFFKRH